MIQPSVLVVEDDLDLYDEIQQTLFSMGYVYKFVTNQQDAVQAVTDEMIHLMLLDLQIPARPHGITSLDYGRNCLEQVRKLKDKTELPVVVMTAHLRPGFELLGDLAEFGPTHSIPKPFPKTGRTLPVVIREAISKCKYLKSPRNNVLCQGTKFSGGLLKICHDRAELMGVEVLSSRAKLCIAVLRILAQKRSDGRFRTFSSQQLTDMLKQEFAELNISGAIQSLRTAFISKLKEANIDCSREDIILHGKNGYVLNEQIIVEIMDICPKVSREVVPNVQKNVQMAGQNVPDILPASANVHENVHEMSQRMQARHTYIRNQISTGGRLDIPKMAQALDCSEKTIRRDLELLLEHGLIGELRSKGCYRRLDLEN